MEGFQDPYSERADPGLDKAPAATPASATVSRSPPINLTFHRNLIGFYKISVERTTHRLDRHTHFASAVGQAKEQAF